MGSCRTYRLNAACPGAIRLPHTTLTVSPPSVKRMYAAAHLAGSLEPELRLRPERKQKPAALRQVEPHHGAGRFDHQVLRRLLEPAVDAHARRLKTQLHIVGPEIAGGPGENANSRGAAPSLANVGGLRGGSCTET